MKVPAILSFLCISTQLALASMLHKPVVRSGESTSYSYDLSAEDGPTHWGSLSSTYGNCSSGHNQSPIDVVISSAQHYSTFHRRAPGVRPRSSKFSYANGTSNFALNCDTPSQCGFTDLEGTRYHLINVHFHAPSEHTINGKHFPLEAHMVHQSASGALVVVGTLFRDRSQSDDLDGILHTSRDRRAASEFHSVLDHISHGDEEFEIHTPSIIGNAGYCTYQGSLTTPPCSEGVTWLLALQDQPVDISDVEYYQRLSASTQFHNNRPVHPLNAREVTCYPSPRFIARSGSFRDRLQQILGFLDDLTFSQLS